MKFIFEHKVEGGFKITTAEVDKDNKVTTQIRFEHDEIAKFEAQCKQYDEEQLDRYY
jgi:hypothetical protein